MYLKLSPLYAPDRICLWIIQETFTRYLFVLLFWCYCCGSFPCCRCKLFVVLCDSHLLQSAFHLRKDVNGDLWVVTCMCRSHSHSVIYVKAILCNFASYSFVFVVHMRKFVSIETYYLFVFGCVCEMWKCWECSVLRLIVGESKVIQLDVWYNFIIPLGQIQFSQSAFSNVPNLLKYFINLKIYNFDRHHPKAVNKY